jgi:hypothetical protein
VAERNLSDEWSARALDTIDTVVATVNDKAVRPVVLIARAVVFAAIIGVTALAALVLLSIGLIRIGTDYLFDHKVWISYLVLGAVFSVAGAFAYSRRGVAPGQRDD